MDIKVLSALIAAIVSITGILLNILLFKLEKNKFLNNFKFERLKFEWQKENYLLEKQHEIKKDVKSELFKFKFESYRKIISELTKFNDLLRKLFSEANLSIVRRVDEVTPNWLSKFKSYLLGDKGNSLRNHINTIVEINQTYNIAFSKSLHEYLKQFWLPNIDRLNSKIISSISLGCDNLINFKSINNKINYGEIQSSMNTMLDELLSIINKAISLNRDLKEQMLKEIE